MFCLNIALGNTSWRLLYKDEKAALSAFAMITKPITEYLILCDDFGQQFAAKSTAVIALMLEDLDKTKLAHVEMALHQERTKVLATKMAQSDPGLKADMLRPGPAIISPMGGNGSRPPF